VAVVGRGGKLTYGQLQHRAGQWVHYLAGLGVKAGQLVAICLEQVESWVTASVGIMQLGGVVVGLDAEEGSELLAAMLAEAQPVLVITERALLQKLPAGGVPLLVYEEHQEKLEQESSEPEQGGAEQWSDGESVGCLLYRAAAPRPVGILLQQRMLMGRQAEPTLALRMSFGYELGCVQVFRTLSGGGCLVQMEADLSPRQTAQRLREQKVTVWRTWAGQLEKVAREFPWALKSVQQIQCDGTGQGQTGLAAKLQAEVVERTWRMWGWDEAGGPWAMLPLAEVTGAWSELQVSAGIKLYLLDGELQPVPEGVVGEVYVGGEELALGYHQQAELSAVTFVPDAYSPVPGRRLYRSGERGRRGRDGRLQCCGRSDGRAVLAGRRVAAEAIEALLEQQGGVAEAAVMVGEAEGELEPGLQAAVVIKGEDEPVTPEQLLQLVKEKMPAVRLEKVRVVERLCRESEGAVDRAAVARMLRRREAAGVQAEYAAGGTEVERILVGIWQEVLNVEKVGIHDNFFKLGGDSILSIQVISRARQQGVEITPRQLFEKQTIAELAAVAGQGVALLAEQGPVSGQVPLLPFQRQFFEWQLARPEHFNQSVLLELKAGVATEVLEKAVGGLLQQHDALRMRYRRGDEGWEQWCELETAAGIYQRQDLSAVEGSEQQQALEEAAEQAQSSLDMEAGRLLQAVEYDLGARGQRLLLVIHHLVVDAVSWRILLEDLERGYEQLRQGKPLRLGSKTTSLQQWGERLQEYSRSETLRQEIEYWSRQSGHDLKPLRLDYEQARGEENLVGTEKMVSVELEADETRVLLQEVPGVYNTQINDVLLTALGRALAQWNGQGDVLVALEGHGREEIFPDIDVSRTVGWFTSTYPVRLGGGAEEGGEWEPGRALSTVKEQLRAVPNRGLGYGLLRHMHAEAQVGQQLRQMPQAQIIFNYLGQVDQMVRSWELFAPSRESGGHGVAAQNRRPYLLDVSGMVLEGKLRMNWAYSEKFHRQQTMAELAHHFLHCLRQLIAHCRSDQAGGYTPSDFVADNMTQEELMQIASLLEEPVS
jgi:non-ribosomal peptide synthase protein (TIGR01720 family)